MVENQNWETEHLRRLPVFEALATQVADLIATLLRQSEIDFVQIEKRAKSTDSFIEKVRRKTYDDPFLGMTDLVGVRVITYYLEDVDRVESVLRREFTVDEENSADKSFQLNPDQFGYLSRHFVLRIGSSRASLIEWQSFAVIAIEVQVRTALQHAWAAVNHKLEYKRAEDVPYELRRGLNRLSALFELADAQFSSFRNASDAVDQGYRQSVDRGDKSIPLNSNSLQVYVEESRIREKYKDLMMRSGIAVVQDPNHQARMRGQLLEQAHRAGFEDIGSLDKVINIDIEDLHQILAATRETASKSGITIGSEDVPEGTMLDILVMRIPRTDILLDIHLRTLAEQTRELIPELIVKD